jgi:hypothetical protein
MGASASSFAITSTLVHRYLRSVMDPKATRIVTRTVTEPSLNRHLNHRLVDRWSRRSLFILSQRLLNLLPSRLPFFNRRSCDNARISKLCTGVRTGRIYVLRRYVLRIGYWSGISSLLIGRVSRSRGKDGPIQALRSSWSLPIGLDSRSREKWTKHLLALHSTAPKGYRI